MADHAGLTRESIVEDLAAMTGVPSTQIADGDDIADLGLDSVRLMSLIEKWRATGAEHVDVVALSSDSRVGSWIDLLTRAPGRHP
ncbi:phosphopantetheine-binding protein [Gordonia shandongensis]|uniref:phosphopantetheine-binding protein n=1 Tax=Gordonia shandongensis TaxID=376351 RepID=UPI00042A1A5E|nr:phosphopantetheine-binding protein [Gordonia shandongensis]